MIKNADIEEYAYSGYGIGFDRRSSFLFSGGGFGQNVLIFGVDMSSSAHIDNNKLKAKYSEILVGPICLGNISKDWVYDYIYDWV